MALEHMTDSIIRILAERTIGERESCRLEVLMGADAPQGVKAFFKAELRRRLEEDLQKSTWFTGLRQSDAGTARVAQTLVGSLTDAYRFTRQEFLDTLDLAVHFVANYLCRPRWTLENFLFDRAPRISVDGLVEGLSFVADFRYLGELALRSLQRRGLRDISREEFQVLVQKIDEEVIRQHNARELASLARPLFAFFQIPGTQPDGAIPVEALLVFYEDKKLRILKEYIRGICHLRNRTEVTLEELTRVVEDFSAGAPAGVPPEPEASAPPAADHTVPTGGGSKVNIALMLTGLRESVVVRSALPEIDALILPEQRSRFIAQVFKGDAAHYAGALVMLDSFKTWRDAETYLEDLCRMNHLDPHTGDAREFSDTVRRRYSISERMPQ
jgi:hypothetical protein